MALFSYTAKINPNRSIQGEIEAESESSAVKKICALGYFPIDVRNKNTAVVNSQGSSGKHVSRKDVFMFTRQLSKLISSGITIVNALELLRRQTKNNYFSSVIREITDAVKNGAGIAESLSRYPKIFSRLYVAMVRSGEAGGTLEAALKQTSDFLEKEERNRSAFIRALVYPLFVAAVGIGTVFILLVFVIPRLVFMFEDMGQVLPIPTKILIETSSFTRSYWWIEVSFIVILTAVWKRVKRKSGVRMFIDKTSIKAPVVGRIILQTQIGRFLRTMALLLGGGLPVLFTLEVSEAQVENLCLVSEIHVFRKKISEGLSLSECLKNSVYFPLEVQNIVAVGEETGTLEKSLTRLADDYESEADSAVQVFLQLLEPVIIVGMGLIVGFIVLSMLLPVFQINFAVQ
ncbi:MAG: type II secretion system F family protein [Candidatus Omnitrophica bacterium]|nr:type II secretion system F family protein [Candidatus Omnitrophota bacterium]